MDYLQYILLPLKIANNVFLVLNLIINGLPSIFISIDCVLADTSGFKPYYKWITFNILEVYAKGFEKYTSFKPYYKWITFNIAVKNLPFTNEDVLEVLNLIINGLPSIC